MSLPKIFKFLAGIALAAAGMAASSCSKNGEPVVILTERPEFAAYAELFNKTHEEKAVVVYRNDFSSAPKGDIVAGQLLKNGRARRDFIALDGLLSKGKINPDSIYAPLLAYGTFGSGVRLLPVSFNLPAVLYADSSEARGLPEGSCISLEELRSASAGWNKKNKRGEFSAMGFAPSWSGGFLYTAAKMYGAEFHAEGGGIRWKQENVDSLAEFLKAWTRESNGSTEAEQDFSFRYLYTPPEKQVSFGRNMFSFISSGEFFLRNADRIHGVRFRWLSHDGKIPVEDEMLTIGILKKSGNKKASKKFLLWFFSEETQRSLLERDEQQKLGMATFGIAGGFSSLKGVNEWIFQQHYPELVGSLPSDGQLRAPNELPPQWAQIKERVVLPYLQAASSTQEKPFAPLGQMFEDWQKQLMN